jgi:Immunoglobulin-like domain of bacterial spore germination/Sporulation and spore germination
MTARTRTRVAALLSTSVVVLAGCGTGDDPQADDPNDPAPTASASNQDPSSTAAPPTATSGSPETVAVPVYFVGPTPVGARLFREFRNVEADNPVDEALALLGAGDTLDPDYSTLLPGQLRGQSQDETYWVELTDESLAARPDGMSTKEAKVAVQQVVYTVQGVLQERIPIGFVLPSGESTPLLGMDTPSGGFEAAPENDVLAFVNVTEPQEGMTVSDAFTASGVANSFEATVPWEVRDADGKQVLQGFATAEGWGDHLYPWQSDVDVSGLAPGTYTFVAMTDDPSDGEGAGPTEDTKTINVG